jgi:hypothetical protein
LRAFILKHAMSVANHVVKEHAIFTVYKTNNKFISTNIQFI